MKLKKPEIKIISLSKSAEKDVTQSESKKLGIDFIDPLKSFDELLELSTQSAILGACIFSLVQGIYGVGYELKNRYPDLEKDEEHKQAIIRESNTITEFLESVDISGKHSWNEFLRKIGTDTEIFGGAFIEILFDQGMPYAFKHLSSLNIRLTELDPEIVFWGRSFYDLDSQKYQLESVPNNFRRYIEINPNNGNYRYYKELNDPRVLDSITGQHWSKEAFARLPKKDQQKIKPANQIWHFSLYHPASEYGLPRWINAINSILCSCWKEENDLNFFKNSMKSDLVISSTVPLSEKLIDQLEKRIKESTDLTKSHSTLLLFPDHFEQALGEGDFKIDVKELKVDRDANYIKYDEANIERVISACRLSKINVGYSKDYNRATSQSALETVENNTFLPARELVDSFINNRIFSLLGVKYHKYVSRPSTKQSLRDKAEIISQLKDSGLTLRELRASIAPLLGINLTAIDEQYLDYPLGIAITLLQTEHLNHDKTE